MNNKKGTFWRNKNGKVRFIWWFLGIAVVAFILVKLISAMMPKGDAPAPTIQGQESDAPRTMVKARLSGDITEVVEAQAKAPARVTIAPTTRELNTEPVETSLGKPAQTDRKLNEITSRFITTKK